MLYSVVSKLLVSLRLEYDVYHESNLRPDPSVWFPRRQELNYSAF